MSILDLSYRQSANIKHLRVREGLKRTLLEQPTTPYTPTRGVFLINRKGFFVDPKEIFFAYDTGEEVRHDSDPTFSTVVRSWLVATILLSCIALGALIIALTMELFFAKVIASISFVLAGISAVVWLERAEREWQGNIR